MTTTNVLGTVYETLLCSPGMNEIVKVDLKINRKTILLLNSVIEQGLNTKESADQESIIAFIPNECAENLRDLAAECLNKAGLIELNNKIKEIRKK